MFFYILVSSLIVSLVGLWFNLPWWNFAIICFVVAWWRSKNSWQAFGVSFAAIAVLWLATTAYIDEQNKSRLSNKVAVIFGLSHHIYLILLTAIIGGIVAGFSGLSGYLLRSSFDKKRR